MELLITGNLVLNKEQLRSIQSIGFKPTLFNDERDTLPFDVSVFEAVVCNSLFLHNDIKRFKSLKMIQLTSAGMDKIPVEYIRANKIKLYNANDSYSIPMAEWIILKILEIYKNSRFFYHNQDQKKWEKKRDLLELTGKTATIIGCGNAGIETAKRLKAFGVNIIGMDIREIQSRYIDSLHKPDEADNILEKSDIIILTIPLNKDTYHFINRKRLARMKKGSILINVSRGSVLDESALIDSLKKGKLSCAALDVFENEPLHPDNPLWHLENVIITPHNSFYSDKVHERLSSIIINNLKGFIA